MPESKSFLQSKTFLGLAVALLPTILGLFGLHISDAAGFAAGAQESVDAIVTLVGGAVAAYGRVKATASLVVKKE